MLSASLILITIAARRYSVNKSKKPPAVARGFSPEPGRLLLAEIVVAATARLGHGAEGGLDARLILGAGRSAELGGRLLELLVGLLEFGRVIEHGRLRLALLALRARVKPVPRHAREVFEEGRVARDDVRVVGRIALEHRADRAEVLGLQHHRRLSLLDQRFGLRLRE